MWKNVAVVLCIVEYAYGIWLFLKSIDGKETNEKDDNQHLPIEDMSVQEFNDFVEHY